MFQKTWIAALAAVMVFGSFALAMADEPKETRDKPNEVEGKPKEANDKKHITNSIDMKLVLIPAGEFMMGSHESAEQTAAFFNRTYSVNWNKAKFFEDEHPLHRVRITEPFYLGIYHVTRGQFAQFVEATGYKTDSQKGKGALGVNPDMKISYQQEKFFQLDKIYTWFYPGFEQTDEHPVVAVTWNDAMAFCRWLTQKEGKRYRLPTEAEWEYACRAGTTTRYSNGDDPEKVTQIGNIADATYSARFPGSSGAKSSDGYAFTSPVGSFHPNAFGVYDMHGNAWEWCSDWYDPKYYAVSSKVNPTGPRSGKYRVTRGYCWGGVPVSVRSAKRDCFPPGGPTQVDIGFRVVREVKGSGR